MMMSPQSFKEEIKELSYEELVIERNKLIEALHKYEKGEITDFEKNIHPAPEVVYQCNNEYLIEITRLLNKIFNQNIWNE